jgi:O-antigen ligase
MATIGRTEWGTASVARPPAPALSKITLSWQVRTTLALCFLTAVVQYEFASGIWLIVPLILLALSALMVMSGRHRGQRLQHILGGGGLWFAGMLFSEAVSYTSQDTYSILYGLVFMGVFLCARLILQEIGIANVIRAYSQVAIVLCCMFLISGRSSLFAGQGVRFTGGTRAHPNLLGFLLAGFFPVVVWRAIEEKRPWRKRSYFLLSLATFGLIFLTGSRGSLSAVLIAGFALLLRGVAAGWLKKVRVTRFLVIVMLLLLPILIAYFLANHRIQNVADYVSDYLALKTNQRGLTSGMSGRTGFWKRAFMILSREDRWLFGFGYRAGDRLVGTIDNGYVQLLFESGLIAGGLIFGSMLRVFFLLWKASSGENNAWTRFYMMLWCLMIVYFFNNISTRYLFSFGSPFSLCVLFMMAASRRELIGAGTQARGPGTVPAARLEPAVSWKQPAD